MRRWVAIIAVLGTAAGCSSEGDEQAEPPSTTLAGVETDEFAGTGLTRPTITADEVDRFCDDVDAFLAAGAESPDQLLDLGTRSANLQFGRDSLDTDDRERLDDCVTRLAEPFDG